MAKKKDPLELNKREKAILKFIEKELEENGYPPSVREIGKAVGLKSTATVHAYLGKLEEAGLIARQDKKGRTLQLIKGGKAYRPNQDSNKTVYAGKGNGRCSSCWKNHSRGTNTCCRKYN